MKKVFLDYSDWKTILFGETGLPLMEQELFDYIAKLASCADVTVILTEGEKPAWVLKYNNNTGKFSESQIGEI
ncbi:MAG: hypothetical protein K9G58_01295 [Bacteroidales bacterium]|nr:hypothetical protein [Bacteroidales bacterium]